MNPDTWSEPSENAENPCIRWRGRAPRVMVIDDDPEFGDKAAQLLAGMGFLVKFHRGPFGSLQALRQFESDVVLLDISMPKLDGPLMSRLIRDTFGSAIRIILCSNMEADALERIARKIGADGFVPKTLFDEGRLEEIAEVLCRGRDTKRTPSSPDL